MLQANSVLQELHIGKHQLRDDAALVLAQYLEENSTLRVLDLRW